MEKYKYYVFNRSCYKAWAVQRQKNVDLEKYLRIELNQVFCQFCEELWRGDREVPFLITNLDYLSQIALKSMQLPVWIAREGFENESHCTGLYKLTRREEPIKFWLHALHDKRNQSNSDYRLCMRLALFDKCNQALIAQPAANQIQVILISIKFYKKIKTLFYRVSQKECPIGKWK